MTIPDAYSVSRASYTKSGQMEQAEKVSCSLVEWQLVWIFGHLVPSECRSLGRAVTVRDGEVAGAKVAPTEGYLEIQGF